MRIPLIIFTVAFFCDARQNDFFDEELFLKQLQSGHVYSLFQFSTTWDVNIFEQTIPPHYNYFPKSFGEILNKFDIVEMHFSMTQGRWRYNKWGYPLITAPIGIELWVWFNPKLNSTSVDKNWAGLVQSLSGQFCSAINSVSEAESTNPELSFKPQGLWPEHEISSEKHLRYATIPRETVCTENLTPWKKLLPCGSSGGVGLASLLNGVKLFDSAYHSLAIHVQSICEDPLCEKPVLELKQTLSSVFDSHQRVFHGEWNLNKLFGKKLSSKCPLARSSNIIIHRDKIRKLSPEPSFTKSLSLYGKDEQFAVYDLLQQGVVFPFDVKVKMESKQIGGKNLKLPFILVQKHTTGFGEEYGGSCCIVHNNHPSQNITLSYLDVVPYFARVYLHTLKVEINGVPSKPEKLIFTPAYHKERPARLEFLFTLPARSKAKISMEFEKVFQDWMQHPPDAHHGFYMSSSVVSGMVPYHEELVETIPSLPTSLFLSRLSTVTNSEDLSFFRRIYSEPLLLRTPLPDFSMPYNVICLTCTVIAIGFGSVYNLTTRTFQIAETETKTLKEKLLGLFSKKKVETEEIEKVEETKQSE